MSCFLHRMQRKEERRSKRQAVKEKASAAGGVYTCCKCGQALFDAEKKFDAGAGFPSFWEHLEDNVQQNFLNTYGRERIQLLCNGCGSHLGHLFENKKTPSRLRYCIKHEAIELVNKPVTKG